MMTRTFAFHALLLTGIVGCRPGDGAASVSDSTFVETMTALARINADESRDSAGRAIARDSLLQSRDLTAEDLELAARALANDPDRAFAIWSRIRRESSEAGI
jgi:hypothetical protein